MSGYADQPGWAIGVPVAGAAGVGVGTAVGGTVSVCAGAGGVEVG
jgi:hypothetical protein